MVHKLAEEGRIAVRHARTDAHLADQEARARLRGRQDPGREGRPEAHRRPHQADRRPDPRQRGRDHGGLSDGRRPPAAAPGARRGPRPRRDHHGRQRALGRAARSLPRPLGHHAGMTAVREVVEGSLDAGVGVLTLFAFSQENWQRPPREIDALMSLLEEYIAREAGGAAGAGRRGPHPGRHRPAHRRRPPGGRPDRGRHRGRHRARAQPLHLLQLPGRDRPGRPAPGRGRGGRPARPGGDR